MPCSDPERWLPQSLRERCPDPHVVVAMSGGVDSSVTALRLREAGLRCSALFMKNWNEPDDGDGRCRWEDDVADAMRVCDALGIPLNTIDLAATYWNEVFEDFLAEYRSGRTPNPDVLCNREIKFKAFLDAARAIGGDVIATGHYVRLRTSGSELQLLKGSDPNKDQSYFLHTLGQAQLAAALFPVGELHKSEVRRRARAAGLATHEKKDSTGICFIGEQRFREFLSRYVPAQPGPVVDLHGKLIGEHQGAVYYTLGQREGLGIGGVKGALQSPWFVAAKNLAANELVAVQGHDHPALMSTSLRATRLSWVAGAAPSWPLHCRARTRYRQAEQACTVMPDEDGSVAVQFAQPQRAVTPGQSVVFYAADVCLGGGIIDRAA